MRTAKDIQMAALAALPKADPEAERRKRELEEAEADRFKSECFRGAQPTSLADVPNHIDKARAMFEYDRETGLLYYAFTQRTESRLQERATQPYGLNGYGRVKLWGFGTSAANVVWLLHNGRWPVGRLRRRDGDPRNDRIENLYEFVRANLPGRGPSKGVARSGPHHWQAYTKVDGVQKYLGRFVTYEEAVAARAAWDRGEDLA